MPEKSTVCTSFFPTTDNDTLSRCIVMPPLLFSVCSQTQFALTCVSVTVPVPAMMAIDCKRTVWAVRVGNRKDPKASFLFPRKQWVIHYVVLHDFKHTTLFTRSKYLERAEFLHAEHAERLHYQQWMWRSMIARFAIGKKFKFLCPNAQLPTLRY